MRKFLPQAPLLSLPHLLFLLAALLVMAAPSHAQSRRDILWNIVSNCLSADAAQHTRDCIAPRKAPLAAMKFNTPAEATRYCRSGSDVWDEVPGQFVAFRDIKMCACPDNARFIHGLAIPYAKVTGVEAANRPDGIFAFAWKVGSDRLGAEAPQTLALAVNPMMLRSQDQLHVHIVRLRADYQKQIAEHPRYILRTVRLKDLSQVWQQAPLPSDSVFRFRDFGVLITADPAGGWILRLTSPLISPEDEYTAWECPKQ